MDSQRVVMDAGDRVEVADANTTNTSDDMYDAANAIVPMQLEIINIASLNILFVI